jgi:hypothetical protein
MRCTTASINGRRLVVDQMSVCLIVAISIPMVLKEDLLSCTSGFTAHSLLSFIGSFLLVRKTLKKKGKLTESAASCVGTVL